MSKHKRKNRYNDRENNSIHQVNNPILNNPFGINPKQLLGMLGANFNMNGLGSLLSSMNMDGFNFNSMPSNSRKENNSYKAPEENISNKDNTKNKKTKSDNNLEAKSEIIDDDNIEMLIALRTIVDSSRRDFVDKIIKLYESGLFEENNIKDE
jgi:hypothetical protein